MELKNINKNDMCCAIVGILIVIAISLFIWCDIDKGIKFTDEHAEEILAVGYTIGYADGLNKTITLSEKTDPYSNKEGIFGGIFGHIHYLTVIGYTQGYKNASGETPAFVLI